MERAAGDRWRAMRGLPPTSGRTSDEARAQAGDPHTPEVPRFKTGDFVAVTGSWRPPEVGRIRAVSARPAPFSYAIRMAGGGEAQRTQDYLRPATSEEIAAAQDRFDPEEEQPPRQMMTDNIRQMSFQLAPGGGPNGVFGILSCGSEAFIFWGLMRGQLLAAPISMADVDNMFQESLVNGFTELDRSQIDGMADWMLPTLSSAVAALRHAP